MQTTDIDQVVVVDESNKRVNFFGILKNLNFPHNLKNR